MVYIILGIFCSFLIGKEPIFGPKSGLGKSLYETMFNFRTSVACPIIDVISDDTFEYITGSDMTWGGFNWKLNFRWYPVPQRELDRRGGDRSQPTRYVYRHTSTHLFLAAILSYLNLFQMQMHLH